MPLLAKPLLLEALGSPALILTVDESQIISGVEMRNGAPFTPSYFYLLFQRLYNKH